MNELTIEQVIEEGKARGAAYVAVTAAVWSKPYQANCGVSIATPAGLFQGKTLEEAFARFMAQYVIGAPAEVTAADAVESLANHAKTA